MEERMAMLRVAFEEAETAPDWIDSICRATARLARLRASQSGAIALRRALHASPQLWELDQEGNRAAASLVADLLRRRADPCPANPELRGRIIAEYVTAILDMKAEYALETYPEIDHELESLLRLHLAKD
jgi:hypothetical protein